MDIHLLMSLAAAGAIALADYAEAAAVVVLFAVAEHWERCSTDKARLAGCGGLREGCLCHCCCCCCCWCCEAEAITSVADQWQQLPPSAFHRPAHPQSAPPACRHPFVTLWLLLSGPAVGAGAGCGGGCADASPRVRCCLLCACFSSLLQMLDCDMLRNPCPCC